MDENGGSNHEDRRSHSSQQQETKKETTKKRCRKFIKRTKWKKLKKQQKQSEFQSNQTKVQIQNLSSYTLTPDEISVLSKGLGFCPTPTVTDKFALHMDTLRYIRKLRLSYHFHEYPSEDQSIETRRFKEKSAWTPRPGHNHALDIYCNLIEHEITNLPTESKKVATNITPGERRAIINLKNNRTIVIKPADKGGCIVIQDLRDYKNEAHRQLRDYNTYQRLTKDETMDRAKQINEKLKEEWSAGNISEDEYNYLRCLHPVTSVFYLLPKIHKSTRPPRVDQLSLHAAAQQRIYQNMWTITSEDMSPCNPLTSKTHMTFLIKYNI